MATKMAAKMSFSPTRPIIVINMGLQYIISEVLGVKQSKLNKINQRTSENPIWRNFQNSGQNVNIANKVDDILFQFRLI